MTRLILSVLLAILCCQTSVLANDYEEAWKALHNNDRKTAKILLQKAMNESSTSVDAYLTYIYLQTFEGRESDVTDFISSAYGKLDDVNPYLYSLWFNGSVLGGYGKKSLPHQLQLLQKIVSDKKTNGSIKSAAHYVYGTHYQYSNDFPNAARHWGQMESVCSVWQYAGPFDNLSGSGFNKQFGPLEHPEAEARFVSSKNAPVSWFTPTSTNAEGWTFPFAHIRNTTAIVYAQTFVQSPADMKALLNLGGRGSLKIWVNDGLVLAEPKEYATELDYYSSYIQLKKGFNRILVQLGYTDNTFPNFIIRLTDDDHYAIKGLQYFPVVKPYTKVKSTSGPRPVSLRHFAEAYFEKKIEMDGGNFLNYLLLSQVYLRNEKVAEARHMITEAVNRFPNNSLLRFQLMQCLMKDNNSTLLSQEVEKMKETDPECLLTFSLNIDRLQKEKKYDEALAELDKYVALFGEDAQTLSTRIKILGKQNMIEELVTLIQKGYSKYPDNVEMVSLMFNITKSMDKDAKAAIKIYEKFLKSNFNYELITALANEYSQQGQSERAVDLYQSLCKHFPYDPEQCMNIAIHYYQKQDFNKAIEYTRQAIGLAPYVASYWESLGLEQQQLQQNVAAIESFKKALEYDRNNYGAREQLRAVQKKSAVWKAFKETDLYALIKNANKSYDHDFYYLFDEKTTVIYAEGATELYVTMAVKILNEKGIDAWKHFSLPYNSNQQTVLVEKAEVVKKNGNKVKAEQDEGELVFTGLEAGDALIIRYKMQYYAEGRLAKEFWDRYSFNAFVPVEIARYSLLIGKNVPFKYVVRNDNLTPEVSAYDEFDLYTWTMKDAPVMKEEAFMAPTTDVAVSLHLSTLPSWGNVAGWYKDLSEIKTEETFEVSEVFKQLFPQGTGKLSELQVAKKIYSYITGNIRYSSVSFRQSAFIPQKPSVTINTRLGDCKDLAVLFVSLGKLAGLKANLILVDTRENGKYEMALPSVEFNHCIVKTELDGKEYFLEVTDNDLPFASLPSNLYHAAYLVIDGDSSNAKLKYLHAANRTKDKVKTDITLKLQDGDVQFDVKALKTGALTSSMRGQYAMLSNEKQKEALEKSLSGNFKNPLKLAKVNFRGLETGGDSITYDYSYKVSNEVTEVGAMSMIKIPFGEIVASLDNFSPDERTYSIEYWNYENTDEYETVINVHAPVGKEFIEIPKNEICQFKGSHYSLQFIRKSANQLQIVRKATIDRDDIAPADYPAMKAFFNKIVKAESKYIVFK